MNTTKEKTKTVNLEDILIAYQFLKDVVAHTPLQKTKDYPRNMTAMYI